MLEVNQHYVICDIGDNFANVYEILSKRPINVGADYLLETKLYGYIDTSGFRLYRASLPRSFTQSYLNKFQTFKIDLVREIVGIKFDGTDIDIYGDGEFTTIYNEPKVCLNLEKINGIIEAKK